MTIFSQAGIIGKTNHIARRTIEPFENNNKRSQGRLGEGGPLKKMLSPYFYLLAAVLAIDQP